MTDHQTNADAIIEAARLGATSEELDLGKVHMVATPGGVVVHDFTTDDHRKRQGLRPVAKRGTVRLSEHPSLSVYVNEHGSVARTTLFADREAGTILAVLNGHERNVDADDSAGWGDHRALLTLRQTDAWEAWTALSGRLVGQAEFAEFLEDRLLDIVEPDGAHLLEVALSIQAAVGAAFKQALRLDSGEAKFQYEETIAAKAGQAGELTIPTRIKLGIAPFDGTDKYAIEARLRYRVSSGGLALGIVLDRPEDVLKAAFGDIVGAVEEATGLTVLYGAP